MPRVQTDSGTWLERTEARLIAARRELAEVALARKRLLEKRITLLKAENILLLKVDTKV